MKGEGTQPRGHLLLQQRDPPWPCGFKISNTKFDENSTRIKVTMPFYDYRRSKGHEWWGHICDVVQWWNSHASNLFLALLYPTFSLLKSFPHKRMIIIIGIYRTHKSLKLSLSNKYIFS